MMATGVQWDSLEARLLHRVGERLGRFAAADRAEHESFLAWASSGGFIADREEINFAEWAYLKPLYAAVPDDCTDLDFCVMKPSQAGASIFAMLFVLWLALRGRYAVGYYLPTDTYARRFSDTRFIRMVRDNAAIHALMGDATIREAHGVHEGNIHVRKVGYSVVYFSSIEGVIATEALALDAIVRDEVQVMSLSALEKLNERIAASRLKARVALSTANFEGGDIHALFLGSDQREFVTACGCTDGVALADCWDPRLGPLCIDQGNGTTPGVPTAPFYFCPRCRTILRRPQEGTFRARNPGAHRIGFHWSQMLSPRQTAASILEKWVTRIDVKNFYNRVLGRPYTDPTQQPVTQTQLEAAQRPDLHWGVPVSEAIDGVFLGCDQMGADNRVVIVGRVRDTSRMRLLHLEVIQDENPFRRTAELMRLYRVKIGAVEALPNFNDAHRFAKEFLGHVFVVTYQDLADELVLWGDRPRDRVPVRRTDLDARIEYSAKVDQYKLMSYALGQWAAGTVETPDARTLTQSIRTDTGVRPVMLCRDMFWSHLQHIALVTELGEGKDAERERKLRRRVVKVGSEDPHFSYAWMLVVLAWVRAYGTEQILAGEQGGLEMGEKRDSAMLSQVKQAMPEKFTAPPEVAAGGTCGACVNFDPETRDGWCKLRRFGVTATLPACEEYVPVPEEESYPS